MGSPEVFLMWQQIVPPCYLPGDRWVDTAAEGVEAEAAEGDQQSCQHYSSETLVEIQLRVGPATVQAWLRWAGGQRFGPAGPGRGQGRV